MVFRGQAVSEHRLSPTPIQPPTMSETPSTPRPRPYVAFPIPDELRDETMDLITELRESDDHAGFADRLIEVVDRISDHGMQYFFIYPTRLVGMGPVTIKALDVSIQTGKKAILTISRQIARRLDRDQLLRIGDFLESLVLEIQIEER
jgi:hypothetical protein